MFSQIKRLLFVRTNYSVRLSSMYKIHKHYIMTKRNAYVLTLDFESERAIFSRKILEHIGFDVMFIKPIPNQNKVLSNKISMQHIYKLIIDSQSDYSYVFEDDINILEEIRLDEIIQYEIYSEQFFYLGVCVYGKNNAVNTGIKINNRDVYRKGGYCRGLHAIGLSKKGAVGLLRFSSDSNEQYMDVILECFSNIYPANVVRYDLESYIRGHMGILYQDRKRFPSQI